jgi:hypothetical protein
MSSHPEATHYTIDEQCVRELVFALIDVTLPYFDMCTPQRFREKVEKIFADARARHNVAQQLGPLPAAKEVAQQTDREMLITILDQGFPAACSQCQGMLVGSEPRVCVPVEIWRKSGSRKPSSARERSRPRRRPQAAASLSTQPTCCALARGPALGPGARPR